MGAYTEIVDFTVTSDTTSVLLNNFGTITKDDFVKIVATRTRKSGQGFLVSIYPNGETTASHYHTQSLEAAGTSVGASRRNDNTSFQTLFAATGENKSSHFIYMKLSENNTVNFFANSNQQIGSSVGMTLTYITSSGVTFPNGITSLNLSGNMATGDRIQIYKLAATKVADITVASNTTQVDISSLSIDKDSEYLLVSDVKHTATGVMNVFLNVNDATTQSDYFRQAIIGSGSSASAGRTNDSFIINGDNGQSVLVYSHIKLSNIGAYTSQNYGIRGTGRSDILLFNNFNSSTSEAITSITKLNVVNTGDQMEAGSRFTLYKLYE